MLVSRWAWVLVLVLLASMATGIAKSRAEVAPPRAVALAFDVYSGGLHLLRIEGRSRLERERYEIALQVRSQGVLDGIVTLVSDNRASGRFDGKSGAPLRFEQETRSRFGQERLALEWQPDGDVAATVTPPAEDEDPVPQALRRGALDPLSALLLEVMARPAPRLCQGETTVFDGSRLYRLRFDRGGLEILAETRYGVYAGPALHCRVRMARIKGFGPGKTLRHKERDPIDVWLMPPARAGLAVPVRLETHTELGAVVAHLSRFEVLQPQRKAEK